MKGKTAVKKPNIFVRMGRKIKEVFSELKKVTWPSLALVRQSRQIDGRGPGRGHRLPHRVHRHQLRPEYAAGAAHRHRRLNFQQASIAKYIVTLAFCSGSRISVYAPLAKPRVPRLLRGCFLKTKASIHRKIHRRACVLQRRIVFAGLLLERRDRKRYGKFSRKPGKVVRAAYLFGV